MHFDINSDGSGDVYIVFENGMMVYLELKKGLQLEKSNVIIININVTAIKI